MRDWNYRYFIFLILRVVVIWIFYFVLVGSMWNWRLIVCRLWTTRIFFLGLFLSWGSCCLGLCRLCIGCLRVPILWRGRWSSWFSRGNRCRIVFFIYFFIECFVFRSVVHRRRDLFYWRFWWWVCIIPYWFFWSWGVWSMKRFFIFFFVRCW